MTSRPTVLVVGEMLWDSLPEGLFLGGAPHNVACHLARLGTEVALVSRVGEDALGREAIRRIQACGLSADFLQVDPALPTGFVHIEVGPGGIPNYDIVRPSAWDALATTDALVAAASEARAVVYGTLAQRAETSRQTLRALWGTGALQVCDLNLRPPFVSREVVEASLHNADLAKLNDEELRTLAEWLDLPGLIEHALPVLAERFGLQAVCVTRGPEGASLLHEGRLYQHPGHSAEVADTVGVGDAFLAALLAALLDGTAPAEALDRANRLGAFVAGERGAIPMYGPAAVFAAASP